MKTTLKFFAFIVLIGLVSSCEDATDIEQVGTLTPDVTFQTVSDLQKGLNGVYEQYSNLTTINFNAVFTDNIKNGISSNGQNTGMYNHQLKSTSDPASSIWSNRYAVINYANRVLDGYNNITFDDPSDQHDADVIAGQLYGLRALSTFNLFQYYSESYTDGSALSVPIMDFVPEDVGIQPSRNTVSEVVDFINSDLSKGEALLGDADLGSIYLSSDALEAIRVRLYTFQQKWQQALDTVNDLLSRHSLVGPNDYINIFKDQSDNGVIFKKQIVSNDGVSVGGLFYFNKPNITGDPYVEMSNDLFNELDSDDIRYSVLLLDPTSPNGSEVDGTNSPDNVLLINKYPGTAEGDLINDVLLIRTAEMVLLKAEAQARLGQLGPAASTIENLLQHRYTGNAPSRSYSSKNDALKDILQQRRFELAYEGFRYFDLKRFREVTNAGVQRNPVDCASFHAAECDLPKSDYRWEFPIPQAELNANSNIQQNPGY